jgi:Ca-activated chloride channel family protein
MKPSFLFVPLLWSALAAPLPTAVPLDPPAPSVSPTEPVASLKARLVTSGDPNTGALRVTRGADTFELPLVDTEVEASIGGLVADVTVTQTFANPFAESIEAVYVFPLPDDAAVDGFLMEVGDRRIVGEIKRRDEARQIYEAARANGQAAALLDQERPNLFTQRVANIPPGDAIAVTLSFAHVLQYDDGGYEWAFPLVVGPRFIPAQGTGSTRPGDAAAIDAPLSATDTGNRVSLVVDLDAGVPIRGLRSPSHDLDIQRLDERRASIAIGAGDGRLNKDFVLRYDVAGQAPEAAALAHHEPDGDGGYVLIMIQPQADDSISEEQITPRDLVFIVDTSCSQSGAPMAASKDAMHLAIDGMHDDDRFTVLRFSDGATTLSSELLGNTPDNRRKGHEFVASMAGAGGTNMLAGIQQALSIPQDVERQRTVLMLTDGYIGNETRILGALEEDLGTARFFTLGTGSSTNRYLIDRMAQLGRGDAVYLRPDEDAGPIVAAFNDRFATPLITDLEVGSRGVQLVDSYPELLPDLYAGQPVILVARYEQPGDAVIELTGRMRGEPWSQTLQVHLPGEQPDNGGLRSIWARAAIEDMELQQHWGHTFDDRDAFEEAITELALEHRLLSQYTSFVAVEERVINEGGRSRTVRVPLETPEFVEFEAVADENDRAMNGLIGAAGGGFYGRAASSSSGVGGLGSLGAGVGGGGYGRGSGAALQRKSAPARSAPAVRASPAPEPLLSPVAPGDEVVLGSLSKNAVDSVVKRHVHEFQRCYERALEGRPGLSGKVVFKWTIDAEGNVSEVEVTEDTLQDASMLACMERRVKLMRFETPPGGGEVVVSYPFVFRAVE